MNPKIQWLPPFVVVHDAILTHITVICSAPFRFSCIDWGDVQHVRHIMIHFSPSRKNVLSKFNGRCRTTHRNKPQKYKSKLQSYDLPRDLEYGKLLQI